jgi:hypothetical protein
MEDSVSIKTYIDTRISHLQKEMELEGKAHELVHKELSDNVDLARQTLDYRLEGMNQFRAQILEERAKYLTREEYNIQHSALQSTLQIYSTTQQDKLVLTADSQENKINATKKNQEDKLIALTSRVDGINKWLIGLMGGIIVALILTIVDMATHGLFN